MTKDSLITLEIERILGEEVYYPGREVIDRSSIRHYAQAISDLNPLYLDEEYAKKANMGE